MKLYRFVLTALLAVPAMVWADGTITGMVVGGSDKDPLPYVNVTVAGHPFGEMTDLAGRFSIRLPAGSYTLTASMIGYAPGVIQGVGVDSGSVAEVVFQLEERMLELAAITVTPGRFAIMQADPVVSQTLSREDIESIPQFGEDIYRAVTRLPGISANDFSAKFTVRGGEHEEVLVSLDGLEIKDPFHLKDINGGGLSIIDVMAIGGIDLMTGGFPAQHGGHLSGVFNISSITPKPERQTTLGISLMNARVMSEGQFNKGDGKWMMSARRGYLDIVLKIMNEEQIEPKYYDVFGKVEYALNDRHTLSTHVLAAGDDLFAQEDRDTARTKYDNTYVWHRLNSTFGASLAAETVLSFSRITHSREGKDLEVAPVPQGDGFSYVDEVQWNVADERSFNVFGLKQDWNWETTDRHLISWGFGVKRLKADYDYFNRDRFFGRTGPDEAIASLYDTTRVTVNPTGNELGLFVSDRFRLGSRVTAEVGLRYDRVSHTDDSDFSPRASVVLNPTFRTALRAGWGFYHQS